MEILIIKKRVVFITMLIGILLISASVWLFSSSKEDLPVANVSTDNPVREIHMVTGEFKSKTKDGKEIEAYRWDPGTIFLEKGESVQLIIYGVNGSEHPFYIEGTDLKGTVKKGEETIIPLQFNKEGTYRLICLTHPDKKHNGPMIAYIVVD